MLSGCDFFPDVISCPAEGECMSAKKVKIPVPILREIMTVAANGGGDVSKQTARFLFHRLDARRIEHPAGFRVECFGVVFMHRRGTPRRPPTEKPLLSTVPRKVPAPWLQRTAPSWARGQHA